MERPCQNRSINSMPNSKPRQLMLRPHFWLSNKCLTPDGVQGIAVPFYLAHPRLAKLEMEQMLEVEGEGETPEMSVATFLRCFRKEVRRKVAAWTGEYQYTIDQVLEDMMQRCRQLHLRLPLAEEQAKLDFTILLTVHTMNYLRSGRHKVAV